MRFRVACVQINPIFGQVEANVKKVKQLVSNLNNVDLVMLPELALTGYNFSSRSAIEPFLELKKEGASSKIAANILKRLKCFTLIGYPEREEAGQDYRIYNSAILTAPDGNFLFNYRKTHLYDTDVEFGCSENPDRNFSGLEMVLDKEYYLNRRPEKNYKKVHVAFGICMDLNPYQFNAPFNKYEMALACLANNSQLILCPMAWLSTKSPSLVDAEDSTKKAHSEDLQKEFFSSDQVSSTEYNMEPSPLDNFPYSLKEEQEASNRPFTPEVPEYSTISYWILRFFPFLSHFGNPLSKNYHKVHMIACNRVGLEKDVLFGGSSSIIQFRNVQGNDHIDNRNPSVVVKGSLGQGLEGVLMREIDIDV